MLEAAPSSTRSEKHMARYRGTVIAHHPQEQVWEYLADLRRLAEWDPSVGRIELVAGDPREPGARYEVDVSVAGQSVTLPYRTVEVAPPERIVFAAQTGSVEVRDEASVVATGPGVCEVTWDADVRLRGWRRLFDLPLRVVFQRLGSRAHRGLAARLREPAVAASNGRVRV